jgi:hypothetical protein
MLVSGLSSSDGSKGKVLMWGLEELELQRTLRQPAGVYVSALLAVAASERWGGEGVRICWHGGGCSEAGTTAGELAGAGVQQGGAALRLQIGKRGMVETQRA